MAYMTALGRKIYFEVHGEGDTLVLLHHGFGCTKMWDKIYPHLVDAGYRVVMYDRRGYGRSEKDADFRAFWFSDQFRSKGVEELRSLINYLGLAAFHIVGQCEGGAIGLEYAFNHPERIKTIAVSSTLCYSTETILEFMRSKNLPPFQEMESDLRERLIEWHGEEHAETFYNTQFRMGGGAYGTGRFDFRNTLSQINCPALVIYPDRSFLFDVEQGVSMYRHLPRGELAVLPACGHNTYEHRPKEYASLVLEFLKRHGF